MTRRLAIVARALLAAVVAQPGFFGPARLVRVVAGDSARAQAVLYERSAGRSYLSGALSAAFAVGALVVAQSYDCAPADFGLCTNSDDNYALGTLAFAIGSGVALVASVPFNIRATRALGRAVWWHNSRFTQ